MQVEVGSRRGSPVTGRQSTLSKFIQNSSGSTTLHRQVGLLDKGLTRILEDKVTRIDMELRYDRSGNRLEWVGDVALHYERLGLGDRLRWIGDSELRYEKGVRGWLGPRANRPSCIVLPDEHSQLTVERSLWVFFILYEIERYEVEYALACDR